MLSNLNRYYRIFWPSFIDKTTVEGRSSDRYRRAAWSTIANGAARATAIITGLISVPLSIHYLGAERFGLWMTISALVSMLQFADFGIGNGLLNKIAEANGRDDRESIKVLISSGMAILGLIATFIVCVFAILSIFIDWSRIFNAESAEAISEAGPTVAVLIVMFSMNIAMSVVVKTNTALQKGYINGIWQIMGNILGLVALVIAIKLNAGLPILVASFEVGCQ